MDRDTSQLDCWGIVELFGHNQVAGRLSESQIAGGQFLCVEVPSVGGVSAYTKYYGTGAIYAITPTTEGIARAAAEALRRPPIAVYGMVLSERVLEAGSGHDFDDELDFGPEPPEAEDGPDWGDYDEYDDEPSPEEMERLRNEYLDAELSSEEDGRKAGYTEQVMETDQEEAEGGDGDDVPF